VILVHDDGQLGVELGRGQHQVAQEVVIGVLALQEASGTVTGRTAGALEVTSRSPVMITSD
jgi:hypothetical protein